MQLVGFWTPLGDPEAMTEAQPRRPFGEYGIQKAKLEAFLLDETRRSGFPAIVLHSGHIVGPG